MLSVDSHHSPWLRSSVLQEVYQAHAGSSPALPRGRLAARTCEACLGVLRPHLPSQPLAAFVLLPAAAAGVRTTSLGAHTDVCGLYSSTFSPNLSLVAPAIWLHRCPFVCALGATILLPTFPHSWRSWQICQGCFYPVCAFIPVTFMSLWSSCIEPALLGPDIYSPPTSSLHLLARHHLQLFHPEGHSDTSCLISPQSHLGLGRGAPHSPVALWPLCSLL